MSESVIVAGARTPIGRFLGSLSALSAVDLGALAIQAALERSGLQGTSVDYVILGQVLTAGVGQGPARQAALKAGIPTHVPAMVINNVCLSGLSAIALADQLIRSGTYDIIVAGGMESMTGAPHLLHARTGQRLGNATLIDSTMHDGLTDATAQVLMGELTDRHSAALGISRATQDDIGVRSHQRAGEAQKNGVFDEEIVPVEVPGPKRNAPTSFVAQDEGVRPSANLESAALLEPAFGPDGTITAANSSQISDGAAAVVVARKTKAEELGLPILAEITAHGAVAGPTNSLHSLPSRAIQQALHHIGRTADELDLIEINEAFAAVVAQSARDLGVGFDKINPHGGAIALGHPIGASGARIVLHLARALREGGGGIGAAGICGGGGQGEALVIQTPS